MSPATLKLRVEDSSTLTGANSCPPLLVFSEFPRRLFSLLDLETSLFTSVSLVWALSQERLRLTRPPCRNCVRQRNIANQFQEDDDSAHAALAYSVDACGVQDSKCSISSAILRFGHAPD